MASGITWTVKSNRIPALLVSVQRNSRTVAYLTAEAALQEIQARAPVDTGALKDGYHVEQTGDKEYTVASSEETLYALPVEVGHHTRSGSWVPPQPHFVPGFDAARAQMADIAKAAGLFTP